MDKKYILIPAFLIIALMASGQDTTYYQKLVAEGNRYFEAEQYSPAADFYLKSHSLNISNPAVDYNLGECYRNMFNYSEAEVYYLKVLYTAQNNFPLSL